MRYQRFLTCMDFRKTSAVVIQGATNRQAQRPSHTLLPSHGKAATLLTVGGNDQAVIDLNRRAMQALRAPVQLEIVPGATHLFEETGKLEVVAGLACDWLVRHLPGQEQAERAA